MEKQILSLLGLARRASRLSLGFDASAMAVEDGNARLVLYASDASEKTVKRIRYKCEETEMPIYPLKSTMDEIGAAVGKRIGVMAVNDRGFANKILSIIQKESN